jgi:actin-related protein
VPLAGRNISSYIMNALRERGENLDSEDVFNVAKEMKDLLAYVAEDPIKELELFDQRIKEKGKMIKFKTTSLSSGKVSQ